MKQLIFDKLRRLWWVWLALGLFSLILGLLLPVTLKASHFQNWWMVCYLFAFSNATTELSKGYGRIALTLPFTTRQIGQTLWFVSVGIPTILLAGFSGLGVLIVAPESQSGTLLAWVQMVFMGGLFFGTAFWLFSGAPLNPSAKRQHRFFSENSGAIIWLALIGAGVFLYKSKWDNEAKYAVVCLLGLIFTILGWLHAEGLVVDYGEYRRDASGETQTNRTFRPCSGFGGIRFLITNSLARLMGIAVLILAFLGIINCWTAHGFNWLNFSQGLPMSQLWIFFLVIGSLTQMLLHLKFLRTLPLTTKQLAGVILTIALLPLLLSSGILAAIVGLIQGAPIGLSLFKAFLLGLAPTCVLVTAAVWHDERRFGRIVVVVTVFLITIIAPIYQAATGISNSGVKDLPLYFVIGYPLLFIFLAMLAISHLLETNPMTYKIRPQDVKGFGQNWS
jgi:hypothetical protein